MWFRYLAVGVSVVGIAMLIISNVMYFVRTRDRSFNRFWLGKDILTQNEYLLNRIGFWLAIAGIVAMFAVVILLRLGGK